VLKELKEHRELKEYKEPKEYRELKEYRVLQVIVEGQHGHSILPPLMTTPALGTLGLITLHLLVLLKYLLMTPMKTVMTNKLGCVHGTILQVQ
jgi:hypothetical protein